MEQKDIIMLSMKQLKQVVKEIESSIDRAVIRDDVLLLEQLRVDRSSLREELAIRSKGKSVG